MSTDNFATSQLCSLVHNIWQAAHLKRGKLSCTALKCAPFQMYSEQYTVVYTSANPSKYVPLHSPSMSLFKCVPLQVCTACSLLILTARSEVNLCGFIYPLSLSPKPSLSSAVAPILHFEDHSDHFNNFNHNYCCHQE